MLTNDNGSVINESKNNKTLLLNMESKDDHVNKYFNWPLSLTNQLCLKKLHLNPAQRNTNTH